MTKRLNRHLLLPLLALCLAFAVTSVAPAQAATNASLQISFGSAPHWTSAGYGVRRINDGEGPGYDMFRYGGNYYAYNNDQWYRSRSMRGNYRPIDRRYVPGAFAHVSRNHWRHYPTNWSGPNDDRRGTSPGRGHGDNGNDNGNGDGHR